MTSQDQAGDGDRLTICGNAVTTAGVDATAEVGGSLMEEQITTIVLVTFLIFKL